MAYDRRTPLPRRTTLAAAAAGIAAAAAFVAPAHAQKPAVLFGSTLDAPLVAPWQNALLPGTVTDDRGIRAGGLGSDIFHRRSMPANEFWAITDRGPNGLISIGGGPNRRTFPIPGFNPAIAKLRVEGRKTKVVRTVPIRTADGDPVTGLSNLPGIDEKPWTWDGLGELPYNQNGLDTEGLVRMRNGDFWAVDEYSPSIIRIGADGRVRQRLVPQGIALPEASPAATSSLPAIYAKRKANRGFEGIAISGDDTKLYVVLQSPLLVPNTATGNASRNTRILVLDANTGEVTGEYAYRFEVSATFDPSLPNPAEMKLSGVTWVGGDRLLIDERTDNVAKLYEVDLSKGTNILGGPYDDAATSPSLEALDEAGLQNAGVTPVPKRLVADLRVAGVPGKIEGVAIISPRIVAVMNDNDFGLGTFDAEGRLVSSGVNGRIVYLWLRAPLRLGAGG